MKKFLQKILAFFARRVLKKYNPDIIGITGSTGKTSTKEAVFTVLNSKYRVRKNAKNYNNEIGMPLTILGCESGKRSIILWSLVFLKGLRLLVLRDKNYPDILILEMGADRPGDIKYLIGIAPCKIGILTNIGHSHIEFFGNIKKIIKEKELIVSRLPKNGFAILNGDDENVRDIKEKVKTESLTYGFKEDVDVRALELDIDKSIVSGKKTSIKGINFKVDYNGCIVPVFLPHVIGKQHIYAVLAAIAVGVANNLNLVEISENLQKYKGAPGRMNIIDGIKNTIIIDDSYNASPASCLAALEVVGNLKLAENKKKYACLGDMLELGNLSEEAHLELGKQAVKNGIDYLVVVGEKARDIARGAIKGGMNPDRIYNFTKIKEAGIFIQDRISEGDLVLVKGSQCMRMENIVKELMADPLLAEELLVRQDEE